MPGTYGVRVTVPGVAAPLTGRLVVEADPLPKFSATDRAARQALLMWIHEWSKTLGDARTAARALVAQHDSLKTDVGPQADSLNARIARVSADVDRALAAVSGQRAPIEGWSGLPGVDQRKSLEYAREDAQKAVAALNRLITTEIPAAYRAVRKEWVRKVKSVIVPVAVPGAR